MPLLYHLVTPSYWESFLDKDFYAPATLPEEGFIHLSTREQIPGTLARHFQEEQELVVLVLSEKPLKAKLKYEPGPEEQLFPHYYGKLPIEAVSDTHMLMKNKAGEWEWV